jgi:hypothetical protein
VTTPPQVETLTELKLTDEIKNIVNQSYIPNDYPILMAYVDEHGRPGISFRGSAIAYSDTQLAVWARNSEGSTATALEANPNVTLVYREPSPDHQRSRAVITFRGQARVDHDETARNRVYDEMPQRERDADPEKKGAAIIVDLDSVTGFMPGYRLQMQR